MDITGLDLSPLGRASIINAPPGRLYSTESKIQIEIACDLTELVREQRQN